MKELIEAIYPGFTFYAVLLTFAGVAFKIARFLNSYEKETKEECFERLHDLLKSFRRKYIEPLLVDHFSNFYKAACQKAFSVFVNDLYQTVLIEGKPTKSLVDYGELQLILNETSLKDKEKGLMENVDKEIEQFLFAASGEKLFNKMDELYNKKTHFSNLYSIIKRNCIVAQYSFLVLSGLLILAILSLIVQFPDWIIFFWCLLNIQVFIIGVIFSILADGLRRKICREWEELQLYDEI